VAEYEASLTPEILEQHPAFQAILKEIEADAAGGNNNVSS